MWEDWMQPLSIISIEDGMDEDDWEEVAPTDHIGDRVQLVGDDLFVSTAIG